MAADTAKKGDSDQPETMIGGRGCATERHSEEMTAIGLIEHEQTECELRGAHGQTSGKAGKCRFIPNLYWMSWTGMDRFY